MALFAFFVLLLGLASNAILLFLVWARLGDIAWSLADFVKMSEKAQATQGMLADHLKASSEAPLSQVRPDETKQLMMRFDQGDPDDTLIGHYTFLHPKA